MRGPQNKTKAEGSTSTTDAAEQPVSTSTEPAPMPSPSPSSAAATSSQGSPTGSHSSIPTQQSPKLEPAPEQPIRKKDKKLNLQSRPRPQGVNTNPFTRHTSLRYRSQPLSLQPLKPGKYEQLNDESAAPRLPPSPPLSDNQPQAQKPTDIDTLLSIQDPVPVENNWSKANSMQGQLGPANLWPGGNAGVLMVNENQAAQNNHLQATNKQTNPFQVNGDDFGSLATRHQNAESKGNPFKTEEAVRWL